MQHFQKFISLLIFPVGVFLALFVTSVLGIIQFHYPRAVENDPLRSPLRVRSISGSRLTLEDRRSFNIESFEERLDKCIEESGYLVDMDTEAGTPDASLFAKRRGWICGTPWTGLIEIPLIPDDVPINQRRLIGIATPVPEPADEGRWQSLAHDAT